jgi:uncharacterized membrane protein YphA (DoxX/SURF4 family)
MRATRAFDNRYLLLACRLAVGGVFIYASLDKILHPAAFAKQVYNYQILSVTGSNLLAVVLPWVELFVGLALVAGILRAESALVSTGLLLTFIGAIGLALARGLDIDCGCFGTSGGRSVAWSTLAQDVLLLAAAVLVLRSALKSAPSPRS